MRRKKEIQVIIDRDLEAEDFKNTVNYNDKIRYNKL